LHHDLTEQLSRRIRRFSILGDLAQSGAAAKESDPPRLAAIDRKSSHIHITGHFAVREDKNDEWVVHVMPLIRVGPPSSPATVAPPVKYPLRKVRRPPDRPPTGGGTDRAPPIAPNDAGGEPWILDLEADEYNQIVERVYSRIATEVYAQIELDVRKKIDFFPTAYLRALALYHEAEDFARSNTIDAYERAISLYRDALQHFDQVGVERSWKRFLRLSRLFPRVDIRYQHQWARVATGYAKCLVYRHAMSALLGRQKNPLFELPELLSRVVTLLERLHKKLAGTREITQFGFLTAALQIPGASKRPRRAHSGHEQVSKQQRKVLFETYVVSSLVYSHLQSREKAAARLTWAEVAAPEELGSNPLYLLAKGLVELELDKAAVRLRQAVDLAPDFQMARWFLANSYEKDFRRRDEITAQRAKSVVNEYRDVLTINAGNIAALGAQGHLLWLIKDPSAKKRLEEGREIKAVARETFVGELNYRLARIAAESENYEECRSLYVESIAADPSVGAHFPEATSRVNKSDYDDIGPNMLKRFHEYKDGVERSMQSLLGGGSAGAADGGSVWSEKTLRAVYSFVLNDYGNACLRYFHYHGEREILQKAIAAYRRAIDESPEDAVPWYNLQNAYGWDNQFDKIWECFQRAKELAPNWSVVSIGAARDSVTNAMLELQEQERQLADARRRLGDINRELERAQIELQREQLVGASAFTQSAPEARRYEVDLNALSEAPSADAANARLRETLTDDVVQALKSMAGEPPATEGDLIQKLETRIHRPLDRSQRYAVITQICKTLSPQQTQWLRGAGAEQQDAAGRLKLEEWSVQKQNLQQKVREAENQCAELEARKRVLIAEHDRKLESAMQVLRDNSRIAALFAGGLEEKINRVTAIPWRTLDGGDVEILIALAQVLSTSDRPGYAVAAQRIAEHLLTMLPEYHTVVAILLDVLARRVKNSNATGDTQGAQACESLLKLAKDRQKTITENWLRSDPRTFLSLYWYVSSMEAPDPGALETIMEQQFPRERHRFENLLGNVYFALNRFGEAREAYRRAIALAPQVVAYHANLGKTHARLLSWEEARTAYQEAHRLNSAHAESLKGLAAAYNQIGNSFYRSRDYQNALDNYLQAKFYDAAEPVYYHNIGVAWKYLEEPSRRETLTRAVAALQKAHDMDKSNWGYQDELNRLKAQLSILECYGDAKAAELFPGVTPLAVEYASDLNALVLDTEKAQLSSPAMAHSSAMRERIKKEYGVPVPGIRWRVNEGDLPAGSYVIIINEIPLVLGSVSHDQKLCLQPKEELEAKGIAANPARDPLAGTDACWVSREHWAEAEKLGLQLIDPLEYIVRHIEASAQKNLTEFLGHQEVTSLLQQSNDKSVRALADSTENLDLLTDTLQALIAEQVPITAIDQLCRLFIDKRGRLSAEALIEDMRMLPEVRGKLPGNSRTRKLFSVAADIAKVLKDSVVATGPVHVLAMTPEACQECLAAVRNQVANAPDATLVVEEPDLRIHLRKLVELEFPQLSVLSTRELLDGLKPDPSSSVHLSR
jgi:tetratricopeptide (TPR) repeat protein